MSEDIRFDLSGPGPHYPPPRRVEYPESNGLPLAETRFQYDSLTYAAGALDVHFRERPDVAVEGNRLLYYVEGDIHSRVAPDVFVVFGVPKRRRRTYLLWEEGRAPDFVLEVTSRSTRRQDAGFKHDLYVRLGVGEYWLFDPTGDWLDPRLQGNRLSGGRYEPLPSTGIEGGVRVYHSAVLGLDVFVDRGEIRFRDPATGRKLLTLEETDRAWRDSRQAREEARQALEESQRGREEMRRVLEEVKQAEEKTAFALEEVKRVRQDTAFVLEEARRAREKIELALEDERRGRKEAELALEDERRRRQDAELALKEARARIAELEGAAPADPAPPPRRP